MSKWHTATEEDIDIDVSSQTIDVYVTSDRDGAIYVEIPIALIRKVLKEGEEKGEIR